MRFGLQRERADVEQEVARDVDVGGAVADQQVEPDLGERGRQDAGGHDLRADGPGGLGERPVQQLVGHHLPAVVEDRLAGDDDAALLLFVLFSRLDHRVYERIGGNRRILSRNRVQSSDGRTWMRMRGRALLT